jgi:hypothetical protein
MNRSKGRDQAKTVPGPLGYGDGHEVNNPISEPNLF